MRLPSRIFRAGKRASGELQHLNKPAMLAALAG
jgi:hypothetical protein